MVHVIKFFFRGSHDSQCFSMACLGGFQQGYQIRSDGMGPGEPLDGKSWKPQAARLDYCTSTKVGGPNCLEKKLLVVGGKGCHVSFLTCEIWREREIGLMRKQI